MRSLWLMREKGWSEEKAAYQGLCFGKGCPGLSLPSAYKAEPWLSFLQDQSGFFSFLNSSPLVIAPYPQGFIRH